MNIFYHPRLGELLERVEDNRNRAKRHHSFPSTPTKSESSIDPPPYDDLNKDDLLLPLTSDSFENFYENYKFEFYEAYIQWLEIAVYNKFLILQVPKQKLVKLKLSNIYRFAIAVLL